MGLAKAEGWSPGPKLVKDPPKDPPKFVYPESEYVFPSRYCPNKRYDMRVPFREALKKAGITDFKWHDYRRTVCTHLIMAGVPAQIIKKIQNWNGTEMIEVYEQLNKAQVKQWVKKATKTFMPKQA